MNNLDLTDHVYIVTGGSKGYGFAIAQCLVEHGAKVGLIARDQHALDEAVSQLGKSNAIAESLDISKAHEIAGTFAKIKDHFGRLDGIVNNAGMAQLGVIGQLSVEEVQQQLNVNVTGTVFGCQAAVPLLKDADNPRIVNVTAAIAEHHEEMAHLSIYAASKAAVECFSRELRRELEDEGIGVTILRPGGAVTEFSSSWSPERLQAALQAWQEKGSNLSMGMESEHVAASVVYCLSCPPGVSIDLLEVRPNRKTVKGAWSV